MDLQIPSEKDWEEYNLDLDIKCAYEHFFGKSNFEMQKEFYQNVLSMMTDLRFMPTIPFRYYMLGFKEFIENNEFDEFNRADAASCFIELVDEKLKKKPKDILPIMNDLFNTVEYVAENQMFYGANIHIYGDFQEIFQRIKKNFLMNKTN